MTVGVMRLSAENCSLAATYMQFEQAGVPTRSCLFPSAEPSVPSSLLQVLFFIMIIIISCYWNDSVAPPFPSQPQLET